MSSALQKLTTRLVMQWTFPHLRGPSEFSCCGKHRHAADLVGCISRLRDNIKEWRLPLLITKLDIKGAFDSLSRDKVAKYLVRKLTWCGLGRETRFLLQQLMPNTLEGSVPGGEGIRVECTMGIRQGAPESAELFALVLEDALTGMREDTRWQKVGLPIEDLKADLLMYQDDLLLWERSARELEVKVELIAECLATLNLQLAASKNCGDSHT